MEDNQLEPLQFVHMTGTLMAPGLSFAQVAYEGEMRMPPPGRDHIDTWPFDLLRTESMGKQYGLVPIFMLRGDRPLAGALAAHDMIGLESPSLHGYYKTLAEFGVGMGADDDVEFLGYWENDSFLKTNDPEVHCSFYRRDGKAFFVFVNRSPNKKDVSASIDWKRMRMAPSVCRDPQNGEEIAADKSILHFELKGHDYRVWSTQRKDPTAKARL
jgi:hypothetical protein